MYLLPNRVRNGEGKYCSHSCRAKSYYPKNLKSFSGGVIAQEAGRKSLNKFNEMVRKDETKSPVWKGSNVKYGALHGWLERRLGKPSKCETCGTTDPKDRS